MVHIIEALEQQEFILYRKESKKVTSSIAGFATPAKDATINDLTFAENGDQPVATDYKDSILIVHPNGTSESPYPGALDSEGTPYYGHGQ
jgi:hypothetical protein